MKELKIFEEYFQPVLDDKKQFEIRFNDRNFQSGDEYCLKEVKPYGMNKTHYTGRQCQIRIKDVFPLDNIGFSNYVAFTFEKNKEQTIKTYLLYVRKYNIIENDYKLKIYKVTTDNIYQIIGKIYCTSIEDIKRIDYNLWLEEREIFWKEKGYEIINYKEPKLTFDNLKKDNL